MNLSIQDVLILDFFNGKPVHALIPEYQRDLYGADANARIHDLCEGGWMRESQPHETVNLLSEDVLVRLLTEKGLSPSGAKADLVRRVIRDIPEAEYARIVPKVYVATAEGQREISRNMAYVLNGRFNYGLSRIDIHRARKLIEARGIPPTAGTVLARAFEEKIADLASSGSWAKLRNLYFRQSNFYLRAEDDQKALTSLFLVFFLDMSGAENGHSVVPYEKLFPTQKGIIVLMEQLRQKLGMTDSEVRSAFLTACAREALPIPYSYFSPRVMSDILIERLAGEDFDRNKYLPRRNPPAMIRRGRFSGDAPLPSPGAASPKMPAIPVPEYTPPEAFVPSEAKKKGAPAAPPFPSPSAGERRSPEKRLAQRHPQRLLRAHRRRLTADAPRRTGNVIY